MISLFMGNANLLRSRYPLSPRNASSEIIVSFTGRLFLERLFREPVANRVEAFAFRSFRVARLQVRGEALAFRLDLVCLPNNMVVPSPLLSFEASLSTNTSFGLMIKTFSPVYPIFLFTAGQNESPHKPITTATESCNSQQFAFHST